MTSFFITLMRFFGAFARSLKDPEFRAMFAVLVGLLLSGTMFYATVEGWGVIDALYFSVMTLATVGYGDLAPSTDLSKTFTVMYVIVGASVFVSLIAKLQVLRSHKQDPDDRG
jgi:voltage-gated potassium channel Kch